MDLFTEIIIMVEIGAGMVTMIGEEDHDINMIEYGYNEDRLNDGLLFFKIFFFITFPKYN